MSFEGITRDETLTLLRQAHVVRFAGTTESGLPLMRTVHPCVAGGWLLFHAGPRGEKNACLGRPVVFCTERVIARIPSYFIDERRACPATTYYESVIVEGLLERVDDHALKTASLAALMAQLQPEGGHVPLEPDEPLYRKTIEGLLVAGVRLDAAQIGGKRKLGQHLAPARRQAVLEGLWRRGDAGDAAAIEEIRRAAPDAAPPAFAAAPREGVSLHVHLFDEDLPAAIALVQHEYWNDGRYDGAALARAFRGSAVWVGARDAAGALIATARAISDGVKLAYVGDVAVAPAYRGSGVGRALMALLLDHPRVRTTGCVRLATRDAHGFYRGLGFEMAGELPLTPQMALVRWPRRPLPGEQKAVGIA
ncbi:MAG: GNAT family N-acetyltransferase [Myxococcales bacterium]|nr:GNAT family N-acetyltransferase [Myxococcales bacterium]